MPLTSEDAYVNKLTNTPNVFTPVMVFTVPPAVEVIFPKTQPIVMKLYKSDGSEIDEKSKLYFAYKKPFSDHYIKLTETKMYREFANLDLRDQRNRDSMIRLEMYDKIKAVLATRGKAALKFTQDTEIALLLNSPDTVDWTKGSLVELPETKIRE